MKIKVIDGKGVYVDTTPCYLDTHDSLEIETPDDGKYYVGYINSKGRQFKVAVKDGKARVPDWFTMEQTVKIIIYRVTPTGTQCIYCSPLRLTNLSTVDLFRIQAEPFINERDLRELVGILSLESENAKRQLTALYKQNAELSAKIDDLTAKYKELCIAYNSAVDMINAQNERVENMEKDYDLLVR